MRGCITLTHKSATWSDDKHWILVGLLTCDNYTQNCTLLVHLWHRITALLYYHPSDICQQVIKMAKLVWSASCDLFKCGLLCHIFKWVKLHTLNSNKKLIYCKRTMQRAMLVNLCHFSHGMGVWRVSNSKVTFKVYQVYWQWCHSIGHIWFPIRLLLQPCLYLAPFLRLSLFYQKFKDVTWLNTLFIPFGSNISCTHSYSSVSIRLGTQNMKCLVTPVPKIWLWAKFKKTGHGAMWPWPCPQSYFWSRWK